MNQNLCGCITPIDSRRNEIRRLAGLGISITFPNLYLEQDSRFEVRKRHRVPRGEWCSLELFSENMTFVFNVLNC